MTQRPHLEMRAGALQMRELERLGHLLERQELVTRTGVSEPKQVIAYRHTRKTGLAQLAYARRPVSFGQRRPIGSHQQREVPVQRDPKRQCLENQPLARRITQMIDSAQHVGDAHRGIIHGIGEEKGSRPALAPYDEIPDVVGYETLRPVHQILELEHTAGSDMKAQARLAPFRQVRRALGVRETQTGPGIARWPTGGELCAPRELELQGRAETGIDDPRQLELLQIALIERRALRL